VNRQQLIIAGAAGLAVVVLVAAFMLNYRIVPKGPAPAPAMGQTAQLSGGTVTGGPGAGPADEPVDQAGYGAQGGAIVVNDQPVAPQQLTALGLPAVPGVYWYDRTSGFIGHVGAPVEGQIMPGLPIGGPALRADASNGNTGVFINGRELTQIEVAALSRQGQVRQGRWWMNAYGVFGAEGGPALGRVMLGGGGGGGDGGGGQHRVLTTKDFVTNEWGEY